MSGALKWLNIPFLIICSPVFYHFLVKGRNYSEGVKTPLYILENLNCWLYFRSVMVLIFGGISCIVLFWGFFLFLTEGAAAKKAGGEIGMGENTSSTINAIFQKPLLYSGLTTVLIAPLAVGQVYMMRLIYQIKADYVRQQNKHREDLDIQILTDKVTNPETELLEKVSYDI